MNRMSFVSLFRSAVLVYAAFSLLCASSAAQEKPTRWTPALMMKFNRVSSTAVSPDGRMVAFTVSTALMEGEKSEFLSQIWVAGPDSAPKMNRQVTTGDLSSTAPAFSPDGRSLAFLRLSGPGEKRQVWTVPIFGGEPVMRTNAPGGVTSFAYSPDGARIAYTSTDPATPEEEKNKKEKRDMVVVGASWKRAHLYVVSLSDTAAERLTSGAFHVTSFDWSPDGSTIVFEHQPTTSPDDWLDTDISIVPSKGGAVTPLVARKGSDRFPHYSPDGATVAFVSDGGEPNWALTSDVWTIPSRGGEAKRLPLTPDRSFTYYGNFLGWSADGKSLYVNEASHVYWSVFTVPLEGTVRRFTTDASSFSDVSLSRDGRHMAFIRQTSEESPEVYLTGTDRCAPILMSNANPDFPKLPVTKTETVTWKSKDGRVIEGLLTYPAGYIFGKQRCPLILIVHGGPHSFFYHTYTAAGATYPIQAYTHAGYAVLRPNPRGSSGYGREFRYANMNDWGFGDFDDLMTGVEHVIGMGVAHPDSLCIEGWSYGGYMTSFAVTRTARFKAASMGAGLSNLSSFTGTSDIHSFIPNYFDGEPWQHPEAYVRHSAIFHVGNVTTPTQVLHGESDVRVPISQGYEFYYALKRKGVTTEMITYPRNPHGLTEPKFIQDAGERTIEWFNKCLGRK